MVARLPDARLPAGGQRKGAAADPSASDERRRGAKADGPAPRRVGPRLVADRQDDRVYERDQRRGPGGAETGSGEGRRGEGEAEEERRPRRGAGGLPQ